MRPGWEKVAEANAPPRWRHVRTDWQVSQARSRARPLYFVSVPPGQKQMPKREAWSPLLLGAMVAAEQEIERRGV